MVGCGSGGDGCCAERGPGEQQRQARRRRSCGHSGDFDSMAFLLIVLRSDLLKAGPADKGLGDARFPSTIFSGRAGKRRGDGPLTTCGPSFGSYCEIMARAFEQLRRRRANW